CPDCCALSCLKPGRGWHPDSGWIRDKERAALIAVSKLPIEVPYHSVIGQRHPGPKERGSDGVVPYWSSHLDGAQSEVIVRSGHGVFRNPEAVQEIIRILRLELHSSDMRLTRRLSERSTDFTN
ncbi:MAG: hypothetical protein WB586_26685, partial [Chthoniobacterales bacterium]